MKKIISAILAITLSIGLITLSGCGSNDSSSKSSKNDKIITVGASSTPHAEILEHVKQAVADKGYELKIVVYDDYVLPNQALADGTIDANYFQHTPYLNSYNKSNNTDLVSAASIHYEPFGIYGNGIDDLKNLKSGATIIIPADDSNETRALFLLAQEGLIKLPEDADAEKGVTTLDIRDNGGYDIVSVQADTVAAQLKNSDEGSIAVINGNYALAAGLQITNALASEDSTGTAAQTYANIIAVKKENQSSEKTEILVNALKTQDVKDFIEKEYKGAVVAIF